MCSFIHDCLGASAFCAEGLTWSPVVSVGAFPGTPVGGGSDHRCGAPGSSLNSPEIFPVCFGAVERSRGWRGCGAAALSEIVCGSEGKELF